MLCNHLGAENIVPEPRAGSNSKARVHPNLKNPRLRPLQVLKIAHEREYSENKNLQTHH